MARWDNHSASLIFRMGYGRSVLSFGLGSGDGISEGTVAVELKKIETYPAAFSKQIEAFILKTHESLGRQGGVIGLSGGLDSAVTALLAVRSLGNENVHLLYLPDRDSNPLHRKHAQQLAAQLGINLKIVDISATVRAAKTYQILPLNWIPGRKLRVFAVEKARPSFLEHNDERLFTDRLNPEAGSWLARGNAYSMAKSRLRMAQIYQYAEVRNLMVVGAANRTEWLTGTFAHWGIDHCADIMPVIHLYRTQIEALAAYLGVPEEIRQKPADPDLLPARLDKSNLLGGFEFTDHILFNLECGTDKEALYVVYGHAIVDHIDSLYQASRYMRETAYHL